MKKNTLDDLELLMADHLDNALHESTEYHEATSAMDEAFDRLKTVLTTAQQELLDQYLVLSGEAAAIREKIGYRQGLRDMIRLLFQDEDKAD